MSLSSIMHELYGSVGMYGSVGTAVRAAPAPVHQARPPRVSIVIAARNYGAFLAEAIESALGQTVPCQVLYVDDSSSDSSLEVAGRYVGRGLLIVEQREHRGVTAARNLGAARASGDYLLFLDGDDVLPADFVAGHLEAMRPGCPFVYGSARTFGDVALYWNAPEWGEASLWQTNFVHTSSLWARWAFEAAGGWRDDEKTLWDWDLALRSARLGTPRRSQAVLNYRYHAGSWSTTIGERSGQRQDYLKPRVRRRYARLSVGVVFSGRLPELVPNWMSSIAHAVHLIDTPERPELVVIDNRPNETLHALLAREVDRFRFAFSSIRILPYRRELFWTNGKERLDAIARFLAGAYTRLRAEMRGDVHWLIEDDILVPSWAGNDLYTALLSGCIAPQAVAGCYRNRHNRESLVSGWWRNGFPETLTALPAAPVEVDYTGTGCLMYWADQVPAHWDSHVGDIPAHDWEWCLRLRAKGARLLLLPEVRCGHAVDAANILWP
jgi:glycosyltransferase involved in cell wall biosynthesis